jgi:endonuclease/exonuclease/phosphatase family metal-dependent hydrolase
VYHGPRVGERFDVAAAVRGFAADVVVVAESWRFTDGTSVLDPLRDDGYTLETVAMAPMEPPARPWRSGHPGHGTWELAVCSRLPVVGCRRLSLGRVFHDVASPRDALVCTIDVGGRPVELVALHVSSKLWYAGPWWHLRALVPQLPTRGPAVVAGDCNLWGWPVVALLRGWRRAVRGRTWPAYRPHSQIDHVLVNDEVVVRHGEVLGACHSDHRPVRAELALLT